MRKDRFDPSRRDAGSPGFAARSLLLAVLAGAANVSAHPVTYAGGTSVLAWQGAGMGDYAISHSPTARYSLGARMLDFGDGADPARAAFLQATALARRWNARTAQANLYLTGGYGAVTEPTARAAALASVEADAESRRLYGSVKAQTVFPRGARATTYGRARAGFAPFLAEFSELNVWAILQAERMPRADRWEWTPLLRFFYRNVLWETGVSTRGHAFFSFMIHL